MGGWWAGVGWGRDMFSDGPTYGAAHVGKPRQSTSGQGIRESGPAEEKLMRERLLPLPSHAGRLREVAHLVCCRGIKRKKLGKSDNIGL